METAVLGVKPKLAFTPLALLDGAQKPTVTPLPFSPVTWVCTEPGKFSLM